MNHMDDPLKRREFMKTISLIGASIIVDRRVSAGQILPGNDAGAISNEFFTASYDPERGTIGVTRSDGSPLLTGGTVCANMKTGKRFVGSPGYKSSLDSAGFKDQLGSGRRLVISSRDLEKELDFETRVSLYHGLEAVTFEAVCKNISARDIVIRSVEPIRVVKEEGGTLRVPGVSQCITNGEMYFDAGTVATFKTAKKDAGSADIKGVRLTNRFISQEYETIHSWWNCGLFSGQDNEGVVLGYLENTACLGNVLISRTARDQVSFVAESVYAPDVLLKPGQSLSSNRVMMFFARDLYAALDGYAGAVGAVNTARIRSIVNGWCSWFYTLGDVSEDEVLLNAEFASKHLKQFGLEYIQIDEGYQRWHGEWEGNERFPHGMKWLAERIKKYGFRPGLWISPYVISEPTEVFQKHPDWLVTHADGRVQRIGNWENENSEAARNENPKRYCLDITHPAAAQWLHHLFDTIAHRWGYEMIKIDFMAWSILAAERYHDPTVSSAGAYRRGVEIMRRAAGDSCHILECGPGAITVGLIDSMRIEADINYGFADAAWKTYFQDPACSAAASAKRYYFHKRTWINDADHVCLQLLTNNQSEAVATLIAMSGGNMISGDRLVELDPVKLEILSTITPSYGEAAFAVDLFDTDMPSIFALKIKKPFAEWTVVAFFNADLRKGTEKTCSLQRLHLASGKTYLAFDFWNKKFLGEVTDEVHAAIPPGSVTLLALHEKTGNPQVLSTDRHVFQGALELESAEWMDERKTLTGVSTGPAGSSHNVFVYVPGRHPWTWGGYVLYRDYPAYSLKLIDENIIQVHVRFDDSRRVPWQIVYEDFFH
jgi:hypothetical protein